MLDKIFFSCVFIKMPFKIRKLPLRDRYRVYSVDARGHVVSVKAKETTLAKAKALVRLLHAIDHGWRPTGKK